MEIVWIVATLAVLAVSLAGNVFQALRYERLVRLFTSPDPPNFFAKEAAEAFASGHDAAGKDLSDAAVAVEQIAANAPKAGERIETDTSLTP